MRTFGCLSLAALALAVAASPAQALPPFNVAWKAKYVEGNSNEAFVKAVAAANCNVCHDAATKSKKDKNEYGKAVGKYLTKTDYEKVKADTEAAKKFIAEGLEKAAAEKAADGKTFADKIKAGMLPAG